MPSPEKSTTLGDLTAKLPAPDEEARREAEKRVRQLFKVERAAIKSAEGKLNLARALREAGCKGETPAPERYVMLAEAIELAADAGEYAEAVQAVLDLSEAFDVSPLPHKADALVAVNRVRKSAEQKPVLVDAAFVLMTQAAAADDFDTAQRVAKLAATMLRSAKDAARSRELKQRSGQLAEMARQAEQLPNIERPEWLAHYMAGLDHEREIDTRSAAVSLAVPPAFDLARSWSLSFEFLRLNRGGDHGLVFFVGDDRGGRDPIAIRIDGHRLDVLVSNSADEAKAYQLSHELAAGDVGRWQRLHLSYEARDRSLVIEVDGQQVASGLCPFEPGIDRPMPIWLGGAGRDSQRFLGRVRMILLANQ
jgi:hypothetical protein